MNMSKSIKRRWAMVLAVGLMVSLFAGIPTYVFAEASTVNSITLGDITPVKDGDMKFANKPDSTDYTIIQSWVNDFDETEFSNDDAYNDKLPTSSLMPSDKRQFTAGPTYYFNVMITPNAGVTFAKDMKVSVGEYGMEFMGDDGDGGMLYRLAFCIDDDADHVHVKSSGYDSGYASHWQQCVICEGVFAGTEDSHEFDGTNGTCTECGYQLPEGDKTKIVNKDDFNDAKEIDCGSTLELTVSAEGKNLSYHWYWGEKNATTGKRKGVFKDSDDYINSGMKVSVNDETLRIENCNKNLTGYLPIVCCVTGGFGEDEIEIDVKVAHSPKFFTPIDDTNHKTQCAKCGYVIASKDKHLKVYGSNVCSLCLSTKGEKKKVREMTLSLPKFSNINTVSEAKESAVLTGTGIADSTNGMTDISITNDDPTLSDTTKLDENTEYTIKLYPNINTDDNFYMDSTDNVYVFYNGKAYEITPKHKTSSITEYYLELKLKPYVRRNVTLDSNNGSGETEIVYADNQDDIYLPTCTFTKDGDEFYAWEYNGKLYAPDPDSPCYGIEDGATFKAVWKSQLIDRVTVLMSYPQTGENITVSDVEFTAPSSRRSDYSISVVWYDDELTELVGEANSKLGENATLDKTKDYTVRVKVRGIGNGFDTDNLKVRLNNRKIEDFKKLNIEVLTFDIKIKGSAAITLSEPLEGEPLTQSSAMDITSSILSIDTDNTYWTADKNSSWNAKYDSTHTASSKNEKSYWLYCCLKYNEEAKNSVLFGDTVSVNGKEYKIYASGEDSEIIIAEFDVKPLYVTVDGTKITFTAPKVMDVTFAMAHYDANNCLKTLILKDISLSKGKTETNLLDLDSDKTMSILTRDPRYETVKIMVFDGTNMLKPLTDVQEYTSFVKQ